MPVVFFDTNALYIQGYRDSFTAGSLTADYTPIGIGVRVLHGTDYLVNDVWSNYTRLDGSAFASSDDLMAYLTAQFGIRRAVGDRYAIPVDIAAYGQTIIPLQRPPSLLSTVRVEVNGTTYRAPDIAVSNVAVTWLNSDFPLSPSDRVSVVYS